MTGPDEGVEELDLDAPTPPARATRRQGARTGRSHPGRRRRAVAVGVAVVLVAVGAGLTAQRRATEGSGDPVDGAASAQQLFPALAVPAPVGREMADDDLARDVGVVAGSGRLLAALPAASYWVARSTSGGVCLVVRPADDELSGGVCTPAADAASGLSLPPGDGSGATLLPTGASTRDVEAAGDAELVPGLWVEGAMAQGVVESAVDGASSLPPAVPVTVRRGTGELAALVTEPGRPYAVVLACLRPTRVKLSVDAEEVPSRPCSTDALVRPFVGTGEPVQVGLQAPSGLVWAAEVVACAGPTSGATC